MASSSSTFRAAFGVKVCARPHDDEASLCAPISERLARISHRVEELRVVRVAGVEPAPPPEDGRPRAAAAPAPLRPGRGGEGAWECGEMRESVEIWEGLGMWRGAQVCGGCELLESDSSCRNRARGLRRDAASPYDALGPHADPLESDGFEEAIENLLRHPVAAQAHMMVSCPFEMRHTAPRRVPHVAAALGQ